MLGIKIYVNDKLYCIAGIEGKSVLTAIVRSNFDPQETDKGEASDQNSFALNIGGLICDSNTNLQWPRKDLGPDDEVLIQIAEIQSDEVSPCQEYAAEL